MRQRECRGARDRHDAIGQPFTSDGLDAHLPILFAKLLAVWVVAEIGLEIIGEGVIAAWRQLYRPPHGQRILAITWITAIVGVVAAATMPSVGPLLRTGLAVGLPGIAMIASFITRDGYR